MSFQTFLFRMMCRRSDSKRDKGLTLPESIIHHDDMLYGTDRKYNLLDVYLPENAGGSLPVIVNFHGGGWVYGTKETYRYYCMSLAEQGFAVVNPSYRLAPKHRFPAAFEDINAVFSFVLENAEKYSFDTGRICGMGDSAGATGMAVYACALTNKGFAGRFPVKPPSGLHICALGLNCGIYTTEDREGSYTVTLPKGKGQDTLPLFNVRANITKDYPPCFLMTAVADFMKDEQQTMITALENAGVKHEYRIYGDDTYPLGHVFHCDIRNETSRKANLEELEFFRSCISI